jgi:hypothetical protein
VKQPGSTANEPQIESSQRRIENVVVVLGVAGIAAVATGWTDSSAPTAFLLGAAMFAAVTGAVMRVVLGPRGGPSLLEGGKARRAFFVPFLLILAALVIAALVFNGKKSVGDYVAIGLSVVSLILVGIWIHLAAQQP